jgi:hypothetical protein
MKASGHYYTTATLTQGKAIPINFAMCLNRICNQSYANTFGLEQYVSHVFGRYWVQIWTGTLVLLTDHFSDFFPIELLDISILSTLFGTSGFEFRLS